MKPIKFQIMLVWAAFAVTACHTNTASPQTPTMPLPPGAAAAKAGQIAPASVPGSAVPVPAPPTADMPEAAMMEAEFSAAATANAVHPGTGRLAHVQVPLSFVGGGITRAILPTALLPKISLNVKDNAAYSQETTKSLKVTAIYTATKGIVTASLTKGGQVAVRGQYKDLKRAVTLSETVDVTGLPLGPYTITAYCTDGYGTQVITTIVISIVK